MPHSSTFEAVLLRVIDVGEADRYCLLFTLEAGKKAARARGVRKPGSRMGGSLLPFRRVRLQITEGRAGALITSVADARMTMPATAGFAAFMRLSQAADIVLALTEDGEPLPGVFHLLEQFLVLSTDESNPLPAFVLRLLHLLGLLPLTEEDARFRRLSPGAKRYLAHMAQTDNMLELAVKESRTAELRTFAERLLAEVLQRRLASADVAALLRSSHMGNT